MLLRLPEAKVRINMKFIPLNNNHVHETWNKKRLVNTLNKKLNIHTLENKRNKNLFDEYFH